MWNTLIEPALARSGKRMMRWLGSSIGCRLGLVLGLMVALVLITGAVGFFAIKTLNAQLDQTRLRQAEISSLTDRMLVETRQLSEHARRAAAAGSLEMRDKEWAALAASRQRLSNLVDQASSQEQYARSASAMASEASQKSLLRSQRVLVLAVVFAVVAAVAGQIMWNRKLVQPVRRAALASEALANGQFDLDLRISTQDECGEMLRAMDRLRRQLQTVAQVQHDLLKLDGLDATALFRQGGEPLPGAYGELVQAVADAVHRSRTSYQMVRSELHAVTTAIGRGDFSRKLNAPGQEGMWHELADVLNQLTDRLAAALDAVHQQLVELSQGNLSGRTQTKHEGLLGRVVEGLSATVRDLSARVTAIRASADSVAFEAQQIAERSSTLAKQTELRATALEGSATAVSRLAEAARETAHNAAETHRLMQTVTQAATRGSELTSHATSTMQSIHTASQRIASIVELINNVAFQTNILALNAAVEAAHAGEQGRGFAIVADEVRSLAGRTAAAAHEIEQVVRETKAQVAAGVQWVGQAGESMQTIVHDVKTAATMIGEINNANQTQSHDIDQINDTIGRLRKATGENGGVVEAAVNAARKLTDEAASLQQSVAVFKLASPGAPKPSADVTPLPPRNATRSRNP